MYAHDPLSPFRWPDDDDDDDDDSQVEATSATSVMFPVLDVDDDEGSIVEVEDDPHEATTPVTKPSAPTVSTYPQPPPLQLDLPPTTTTPTLVALHKKPSPFIKVTATTPNQPPLPATPRKVNPTKLKGSTGKWSQSIETYFQKQNNAQLTKSAEDSAGLAR